MGTFTSIYTSASALRASQSAMEILSNNIANANTEGYKRQMPVLVEGNPGTSITPNSANVALFTGTGVQMVGIRRIQDAYLDNRITSAQQSTNQYDTTSSLLQSVESQFGEPDDTGVATLLDSFWQSWGNLASNPQSLSARQTVVDDGNALCERITEIYSNLKGLQRQMDTTVTNRVAQVNQIAGDIVEVNQKIVALGAGEYAPNELLDRRDQLVEDLSKIVDVQTSGNTGQDFILNVGGVALVQGTTSRTMQTQLDANGHVQPCWSSDVGAVKITSGELRGIMDVRDQYIPTYMQSMDSVVSEMVSQVNSIHSAGYDMQGKKGWNFFTSGTTAANVSVDASMQQDCSRVAVSATGADSNTATAQAVADLANTKQASLGNLSISQAYRNFIAQLGGDVSVAKNSASTREYTLEQLQKQKDSVSGVSLDDELVDMIKYQHAYGAAARVLDAASSMLQTLIDQTGR